MDSCLTQNQSGLASPAGLPDNAEVEYGFDAPENIAEVAEMMMAGIAASAPASVSAPKVARYYQGRACTPQKRSKANINKIVMHTPEGSEAGTLSVLNGTGASFDWFLPLNGNFYRCNDYYNYIAWQAGDWPTNQTSIGIEQGDYASRSGSFGDAHYKRLAQLCAYLAESLDLNIRRTRDKSSYGFISHADVTPASRTDPGAGFLWDKLLDLALDYRRGQHVTPDKPDKPEKPSGKLYRVKTAEGIPKGEQLGAYSVKTNADTHVKTLKMYGIETTIS